MISPKALKSALFSIFLCCIISGCTYISEQEQLISGTISLPPDQNSGICTESLFDIEQISVSLPGLSSDSISILDWNIKKGKRKGWDIDFMRLSYGKDIILLQEASLNEKLMEMLQQNNLYWNLNSALRFKGIETGVLLASTVPAIASCGQRTSEPIIGVPKTILISKYEIENSAKDLLVATIHAINITLGTGSYREQCDKLLNILQKHDGPIILAGDFNNWSKGRTKIMTDFAKKLSLHILPIEGERRSTFFGDPVDHILYRGLKPLGYEVYPVTTSDHNPISVTFRLTRTEVDKQ